MMKYFQNFRNEAVNAINDYIATNPQRGDELYDLLVMEAWERWCIPSDRDSAQAHIKAEWDYCMSCLDILCEKPQNISDETDWIDMEREVMYCTSLLVLDEMMHDDTSLLYRLCHE